MKKILGIIGSPRKLGNCEIMVKEISRHISEPHELQLLRLPAFNISPCKACYACLFGEKCVQNDDFSLVLEAVIQADAIIVAAPTYLLGANSCLKRFLDRGLAFYNHVEKLWGKPAVGVSIAGKEGMEGATKLNVDSFMKLLLTEIKGHEIIFGALPGEIFLNEENKRRAAALAKILFGKAMERRGPCCPLCGGASFRFLGGDNVRCLLCSGPGRIERTNGEIVFEIIPAPHVLFLNKEAVFAHAEWLRQMKDRFIQNKIALKEICTRYLQEGNWINPLKTL
jgi:multimeric flavodoxin WrbA